MLAVVATVFMATEPEVTSFELSLLSVTIASLTVGDAVVSAGLRCALIICPVVLSGSAVELMLMGALMDSIENNTETPQSRARYMFMLSGIIVV